MSTEGINSSPKEIVKLAGRIATGMQKINSLNTSLADDLTALGTTFQDSGYTAVKSEVADIQSHIISAEPKVVSVCNRLLEYAELLKKAKSKM